MFYSNTFGSVRLSISLFVCVFVCALLLVYALLFERFGTWNIAQGLCVFVSNQGGVREQDPCAAAEGF